MTRRHSLFVVSLFFIGSVCGALLAGPLNHQFGTKRLAIFIALVINIQWGIVAFKTNLTWILISRIVSGMCYGAFLVFGEEQYVDFPNRIIHVVKALFGTFQ